MNGRWLWAVGLGLLAFGCTRAGFDPGSSLPADAAMDVASADRLASSDGGDGPASPCGSWVLEPRFGSVELHASISSPWQEQELYVSADNLTIWFVSDRPGGAGGTDLYRATRPRADVPFGAPENVAELNTAAYELGLRLSLDGLSAVMAAEWSEGQIQSDLWLATRQGPTAPFTRSAFVVIEATQSAEDEWDPLLSADGLRLYFVRQDGLGVSDFLVAARDREDLPFRAPSPLAGLAPSPEIEGNPALRADELLAPRTNLWVRPGWIRGAPCAPKIHRPGGPV